MSQTRQHRTPLQTSLFGNESILVYFWQKQQSIVFAEKSSRLGSPPSFVSSAISACAEL
jgi:hypothetical protein